MTTDNTSRGTAGRIDLPFGLAAFARQPVCPIGISSTAPMSAVYRSTRHRAIASARDSDSGQSAWFPCSTASGRFDFEDEFTYLTADEMKIVDAGDSDVISDDKKRRHGISTLSWIERSRDGEPGGPSAPPLSVAFRIDGR